MKVSEIIEFKNKKIKKLNLEKELTEQVTDWILEILNNVKPTVSSRVEFKEEDICIDKTGYFTVKVDGSPMGFEVRKLQNDNFIYTLIDLDLNFFKKSIYKYNSIAFATEEFLDKIGGQ
jgi:hypothetical protein